MFDPPIQDLCCEIREAELARDQHLKAVNKLIREYTGRWYHGTCDWDVAAGSPDDESNPEPFSYSFVSNMLPALIYENPSVAVSARRVIGHRVIAEAMESGLKAWINDVQFKKECERVVLDFLFFQGVLMHYLEDDTRWSDGAVRPNVVRIDCRHYGCDPLADSHKNAEYCFHSYWIDVDDLSSDPAILPDALARIKPQDQGSDLKKEPFKRDNAAIAKRKRVKVYSVWLRRANKIRVIMLDPEVELYEGRPYYGPPDQGPYSVFQAYPVPGQPYPLSPLIAVQDQIRDLQVHARSAARSAAGRKTVIIVDSNAGNLANDVTEAEDREVITCPGFNSSQAMQVEFGGVSNQQYEYLGMLRERLDRHSGLTQATRGSMGQADTATEAQIGADALNNRTEYLKGRVREGVADTLKSVGWFLFHTPGIIIPVSPVDPITGIQSEGLFFGGPTQGIEAGSWLDYSLKIEPMSMQRVSEQVVQRRAMDFANFIMTVAPIMPQIPWVRWMELIRMVGEAMNQDNTDTLMIPEILGMLGNPEMMGPSQALGGDQVGQRYSIPGQGFKSRMNAEDNSNVGVNVDENRRGFGEVFGKMGGGKQGPPGSAATGALMP